jgi:uncharacterized cupredoxin-like copper-binding protein
MLARSEIGAIRVLGEFPVIFSRRGHWQRHVCRGQNQRGERDKADRHDPLPATLSEGKLAMKRSIRAALLVVGILAAAGAPARSHDAAHYSAGEPGDPKKPAETILVIMREGDGKMMFIPDRLELRKGQQVRFILRNNGLIEHEFVLATTEENVKHSEEMKKNPEMEHDDPNARRVPPKKTVEILWRFTKAGQFEYGCLIPGHREAGMTGIIVVK